MADFELGVPVDTTDPAVEVTISSADPLSPGTYTFQLEVIDDKGNISGPAKTQVVIAETRITVPDVTGLSTAEATALLADLNLTLEVVDQVQDSAPAGTILEQNPAAGSLVDPGSVVQVIIVARAKVIVGVLGHEPNNLYLYGTSSLAADHVIRALYDGPFDQFNFAYQPVIFENNPDPVIRQVTVNAGQLMVVNGRVVTARSATTTRQMSIVYQLRQDLSWDDGQPVTAKDSVFSFALARDSGTPTSKFRVIRTAGYEAVDEFTIRWQGLPGWTDAAPMRNFWTPLPAHILDGIDPREMMSSAFAREPLGYGPYRLESWDNGQQLTLTRHPAYFRQREGLPLAETVALRFVPDSNMILTMLASGELDTTLVGSLGLDTLPKLNQMAANGELDIHFKEGNAQEYLFFNLDPERDSPLQNVLVRQAIAFALDRMALIEDVLGGAANFADSFIPRGFPFYADGLPPYELDQGQAMSRLEEAGFANGLGQSLLMLVPEGRSDRAITAELIQNNLADIGIEVEVVFVPPQELFAKGPDTPLFGRRFDMALVTWVAGAEPPAELFLCEESSNQANAFGGPNFGGYCNEEFDAAALAAMSAASAANAEPSWQKAQFIFAEELPAIPLYQCPKLAVTRPGFAGFELDPTQPSEVARSEIWSA